MYLPEFNKPQDLINGSNPIKGKGQRPHEPLEQKTEDSDQK